MLVFITPREPTIAGRIEWRDHDGKWTGDHTFPSRSNDCGELVRAMGFALALQIDLLAAARSAESASEAAPHRHDEPAPSPVTTPAAPAVPAPPAPPIAVNPVVPPRPAAGRTQNRRTPAARGPSSVSVSELLWDSVGHPTPSPSVACLVVWRWSHASLELGLEADAPATTRRNDNAGFSQRLVLSAAAGCGIYERWRACLLGKVGRVHVEGKDIDVPASPWGTLFETGIRAAIRQPLGSRAFLEARAEGLVKLATWTVYLDRAAIWSTPRLTETIGIDFGVVFP